MTIKKLIAAALSMLLIISILPLFAALTPVSAADDEPSFSDAKSAFLYSFDNKSPVWTKNADDPVYPCSTVKLMTGIVALENLRDRLDETVTVTNEMLVNVSGNNIKLAVGDKVKIGDMLGVLLVNGANDAAYVLAICTAGSVSSFVQMMNEKAASLGASGTYYTNPTGMHDESMVTTARDTCTIALYAYNLSGFMDYDSALKYTFTVSGTQSTVYNRNCLLSLYYDQNYYYDKAVGMNAGSTYEGGYCVVTTASNGEMSYLAVVMDADSVDDKIMSYVNAQNMFEWAFASYMYLDVLSPETVVCEVPVNLSVGIDHITLVSGETLSVYLPVDTDIEKEITLSFTTNEDELTAPIEKGQLVGRVTALYHGEPIGTADLISTVDVERSDLLFGLSKISAFTKSTFFVATLITAIILSIAFIIGKAIYLKHKKPHNYR